ncbi:MAG: diguanylate cyclase, partial [Bryobacterales bacterium]|nr:diguanylate cyclase [Bryobacterales bacterium]
HPMLDVIEPETAGAQETAIEQETPIAQETVAEQEALAEPQPFVADLHDSEPVLLLVEEDTPLPAPDGSTTALLESDPAQAAEPEVAALEVTEPVADYQQLPEGVETSSLFLVSPQPEVEPEPVEPAGTISNEEVAVEPARGEPQFAESVLADEPELEALIPEVVNALHPLELPVGFHHRQVLDDLLKSTAVVNGVVVVIGINDYSHHSERMGRTGMKEWMASVETMIRSLLTEKDFGCRSSEDEFVLVFPGETGTAAQRRLNAISERLWSFQLRSLGAFSVIFCWGAVEIQGETLADATASASERMYQTKRNRKGASMESGRPRKAVNL